MQKTFVRNTAFEEKKIMMYKFNDEGKVNVYSKDCKYKTITHEQFTAINNNSIHGTHLLVKEDDELKLSLRKQYKLFIKKAKLLKKITKGKINLYKTGCESKTSLRLFYDSNPPQPDKITPEETAFLRKCKGQLKHGIEYKGKGWKLDIVSEYPSIMRNDHMQFPISAGKLITLTKEEFDEMKYFKYGIYHVQISSRIDPFIFRFNEENYYTHIDLNFAKTLGYKLNLIIDNKPNFLSYEGKLINGAKLFRPFVDYLYNFKNKGFKTVKKYLNCLWGMLCKVNVIAINTAKDNSIHEDKDLIEICPVDNNKETFKIDLCNKDYYYENDFGRIAPFMLAKGRYNTAQYILKNIKDVVYVNTDGFILKNEPKDITFGGNIGDIKLEEFSEEIEVKNSNKYEGFTKNDIDPFEVVKKDSELAKKLKI